MQVIGWIAIYIVVAWLFGFWPFEEGLFTGPTSECSYDAGYDDGYDGAMKCTLPVTKTVISTLIAIGSDVRTQTTQGSRVWGAVLGVN